MIKRVPSSALEAGQVVHFYGARFRLRDDRKEYAPRNWPGECELPCYAITGDWIDGETVRGYFGPETPWTFQGNDRAAWAVEV